MKNNSVIVSFTNEKSALLCPFSKKELQNVLLLLLDKAFIDGASLDCVVLTDEEMEDLQKECFQLPGPTNILSFPTHIEEIRHTREEAFYSALKKTSSSSKKYLGSLALSSETLGREVFLYQQDAEEHCCFLLTHGLAHLLGYDHGPEMDQLCKNLQER